MVWRSISSSRLKLMSWALVATCLLVVAPVVAQRGRTATQASVPPVSMTCPMHPDVVEASPGDCPICKMKLVPVRLDTVWTCPVHRLIVESKPGTCPIDHRDLIQMTVALTWTCPDHPEIDHIDRGTCADGASMVVKRTLRPHGNHNPQHGGQFFMAPDNFHHLEGAYPRSRVFRLYLYDDYARPLPAAQLKQVKARVVTRESRDTAAQVTKEIAAFPLVARNGRYLEGRIDAAALPAQMSAKVQFKREGPEYRFDFTFPALTKNPVSPSPAPQTQAAGLSPAPPAASKTAGPVTTPQPAIAQPAIDPSLVPLPIPDSVGDIVAQLKTRNDQVGELIRRGDFTAVYVPAFQARDLAIALESHLGELAAAPREAAEPAIARLVRTAWLLDAFGDLGNRQQIADAYAIFTSTVADVVAAFK
jgi:hypothetical protein